MSAHRAQGVLAIWHDIAPGYEDKFEFWYKSEHFPERIGVPGFRRGRRFEAVAGTPRYFCYYLTDTPEVLTSPAYMARLNDPTPLTREMMSRAFRNMSRTICRRVLQSGRLWGTFCVVLRFRRTAESQDYKLVIDALAEAAGVARAEWWSAADESHEVAMEENLRGGDSNIAGCLMIETLRQSDAECVARELAGRFTEPDLGIYRLLCEIE